MRRGVRRFKRLGVQVQRLGGWDGGGERELGPWFGEVFCSLCFAVCCEERKRVLVSVGGVYKGK